MRDTETISLCSRLEPKLDSSNKSECSSRGQPQNSYDTCYMEQQSSRNQGSIGNREMQNLITSHLEASKIGRYIADTALDDKKKNGSTQDSSSHNRSAGYRTEVITIVIFDNLSATLI